SGGAEIPWPGQPADLHHRRRSAGGRADFGGDGIHAAGGRAVRRLSAFAPSLAQGARLRRIPRGALLAAAFFGSCGRARSRLPVFLSASLSRAKAAAGFAGGLAEAAAEGAAEGAFGLVADFGGDLGQRQMGVGELVAGEAEAEFGEELEWGHAGGFLE